MAETHHDRTSMPPRRDGADEADGTGQDGEGDAQIRSSPPNVERTEPPADAITADGHEDERADDEDTEAYDDADEDAPVATAEAVDRLQREVEAAQDRYLRMVAEFDNYRRRTERERAELPQRVQADVVKGLLDVVDDLGRVAGHDESTPALALLEGVRLVDKKLARLLAGWGLAAVDPAGEPFDPNTMDAVAAVPAEHPEEDDVVLDVFQKGYRIGDTLVRPARVRVKKYEG